MVIRPVFILGTGRCGSTMLSDMLARSPDVLMLSELFVSLSPGAFPEVPIGGHAFWDLLTTPRLKYSTLIKAGVAPPELLYAHRRSGRQQGRISPLLLVTLAFLSDDPDSLLDWLEDQIRPLPIAPVGIQYRFLFEALRCRFDRRVIVERSGGSLRFAADLHRVFPEALFVHLHRNGPDCARSMSGHAAFRLAALIEAAQPELGCDPFHSTTRPSHPLPAEIRAILPESFDPHHLQRAQIPIDLFGRMWSAQIIRGVAALRRIAADQVYSLRYEELVDDPVTALRPLAQRIGVAEGAWIESAATIPCARPAGADETDALLRDACRLGARMLGDAG